MLQFSQTKESKEMLTGKPYIWPVVGLVYADKHCPWI